MSKLETQRALPRRKLYRTAEVVPASVAEMRARLIAAVATRPKRKAKKANGKR
jgi:hypothetical protein